MSLSPESGQWHCARGAMCFAPCPGCPYASGEIPLPHRDWIESVTFADESMVFDEVWGDRARRARWQGYLMGFAEHAATMSKDTTKVGAVLVGPDGEVRLTAYNGPPRGVHDSADRFERPKKYLFASHGEQNLIAFAARAGIPTKGCTVYVTHKPCSSCTKSLIQAGIVAIYYGAGTTKTPDDDYAAATEMLQEAGVHVEAVGA